MDSPVPCPGSCAICSCVAAHWPYRPTAPRYSLNKHPISCSDPSTSLCSQLPPSTAACCACCASKFEFEDATRCGSWAAAEALAAFAAWVCISCWEASVLLMLALVCRSMGLSAGPRLLVSKAAAAVARVGADTTSTLMAVRQLARTSPKAA